MTTSTLNARKRRHVQQEVAAAALRLFRVQGYDATSVDDIAPAAGKSRRTYFRYFRSKDDVAGVKWHAMGETVIEALAGRPESEAPWPAVRGALDVVVSHYADPAVRADAFALDATVAATPALRTAFLRELEDTCRQVAQTLAHRGADAFEGELIARVAAAALVTAMDHARRTEADGLHEALDRAFAAVAPTSGVVVR